MSKQLNENFIKNLITKILIFMVSGKSIKNIEKRYKDNPELTKQLKETHESIVKLRKHFEEAESRVQQRIKDGGN